MKNLWRLRRFQELSMVKDDMAYGHPSHHGNPFSRHIYIYMVGGFNPSEKYESQLGLLFQIYGENMFQKNTHIYIYTSSWILLMD
jgi:hypothetical protein